jgi:hypothetical protein
MSLQSGRRPASRTRVLAVGQLNIFRGRGRCATLHCTGFKRELEGTRPPTRLAPVGLSGGKRRRTQREITGLRLTALAKMPKIQGNFIGFRANCVLRNWMEVI